MKDKYPNPLIETIVDDCGGCEMFSFMDNFSVYNQINIPSIDQHKTAFICPRGTLVYKNSLSN